MEAVRKNIQKKMLEFQNTADYVEAENFRIRLEKCQEALQNKNLSDMKSRHDKELSDLANSRQNELLELNTNWDAKLTEFRNESQQVLKEMHQKHRT